MQISANRLKYISSEVSKLFEIINITNGKNIGCGYQSFYKVCGYDSDLDLNPCEWFLVEQKNKGLRLVQQQREKALDRFESTIDTQKLRKEKIKRKLSALMNEKQAKLIEASKGEVTKFQYEFKDSTGKFINTGRGQSKMQIQPQSHELSQDDKMMPSLREPVLFGSLFEPSQL